MRIILFGFIFMSLFAIGAAAHMQTTGITFNWTLVHRGVASNLSSLSLGFPLPVIIVRAETVHCCFGAEIRAFLNDAIVFTGTQPLATCNHCSNDVNVAKWEFPLNTVANRIDAGDGYYIASLNFRDVKRTQKDTVLQQDTKDIGAIDRLINTQNLPNITVESTNPDVKVWVGGPNDFNIQDTENFGDVLYACVDLDHTGVCDFIEAQTCNSAGGDWYRGVCCGTDLQCNEVREFQKDGRTVRALCGRTAGGLFQWANPDEAGEIHDFGCPTEKVVNTGTDIVRCGPDATFAVAKEGASHEYVCKNGELMECGAGNPFSSINRIQLGQKLAATGEYCASDGDFTTELDGKDARTCAAAGFTHTGSKCCGELEDEPEFYNELRFTASTTPGGCYSSSFVELGRFAKQLNDPAQEDRRIINLNGSFIACNPQISTAAPTQPTAPTSLTPTTYDVSIIDSLQNPLFVQFVPATLTINAGDKVVWRNNGDKRHTVTSTVFNSGNIRSGNTFEYTFTSPGIFEYRDLQSNRIGTVAVLALPSQPVSLPTAQPTDPALSALKDTHTNNPLVQAVGSCGTPLLFARPTGIEKHARCNLNSNFSFHASEEPTTAKPAPTPEQPNGCCPATECWNGNACQQSGTFFDAGEDGFFCQQGTWRTVRKKFSPDRVMGGFCPEEDQCLVHTLGNTAFDNQPDKFLLGNPLQPGTLPRCLNNGQFIFDFICNHGNWTSRTKLLAVQLLSLAQKSNAQRFTISCDTSQNTLNTLDYDAGQGLVAQFVSTPCVVGNMLARCVNNFCTLKFPEGTVALATSGNIPINDTKSILRALNTSKESCNAVKQAQTGTGLFGECTPNPPIQGKLYFNPDINSIVYLPPTLDTALEDTFTSAQLEGILNFVFTKHNPNNPQFNLTFFNKTTILNTLVYSQKENQKIFAFLEQNQTPLRLNYLGVSYSNINLGRDPCFTYFKRADTQAFCENQTSPTAFIVISKTNTLANLFADVAAKLRLV